MVCRASLALFFMNVRGDDYFLNHRGCRTNILALEIGNRDKSIMYMVLRLFYNRQGTDA